MRHHCGTLRCLTHRCLTHAGLWLARQLSSVELYEWRRDATIAPNVIPVAMAWSERVLYLLVTVASLQQCDGSAAGPRGPSSPGGVRLRAGGPTRNGSLTFKFGRETVQESPRGKMRSISRFPNKEMWSDHPHGFRLGGLVSTRDLSWTVIEIAVRCIDQTMQTGFWHSMQLKWHYTWSPPPPHFILFYFFLGALWFDFNTQGLLV